MKTWLYIEVWVGRPLLHASYDRTLQAYPVADTGFKKGVGTLGRNLQITDFGLSFTLKIGKMSAKKRAALPPLSKSAMSMYGNCISKCAVLLNVL